MSVTSLPGHRVPDELPSLLASLADSTTPDPNGSASDRQHFLQVAEGIELPEEVTALIAEFKHSRAGALLLTNVLPDGFKAPKTPKHWAASAGLDGHVPELALVAVASKLGAPFSFASQHEGRLIQHVLPLQGQEAAQTSWGSTSFLEWHVEDAFSDERCDYFGLLCLRSDEGAETAFVPASLLSLRESDEAILRQPRFRIRADGAHCSVDQEAISGVLGGPADNPTIRFDPLYTAPVDAADQPARDALTRLADEVGRVRLGHVLDVGEMLIVDNRRCVHARTAYVPRYDGTDRWLLRVGVLAREARAGDSGHVAGRMQ